MDLDALCEALRDAGLSLDYPDVVIRSTGVHQWPAAWTDEQRATAETVSATFDWSDAAQQAREVQARRREVLRLLMSNEPVYIGIRALGMLAMRGIGEAKQGVTTPRTWAECLADFKQLILTGAAEMPATLIVTGESTPAMAGTYLPLETLGQWGCLDRGAYLSCPGGTWLLTTNTGGLFVGPLEAVGPIGSYLGSGESTGTLTVTEVR